MDAQTSFNSIVIEATVIRADGTREELGVISEVTQKKQSVVKSFISKVLGGK